MKIELKSWRSKLGRLSNRTGRALYRIFVVNPRGVDVLAGVIMLSLAACLTLTLLYLPPRIEQEDLSVPELNVSLVDRLVELTQDRARSREVGFVLPPDILGP